LEPKARYVLRPEARPLRWDLLNDSQRVAFRKILDALEEARGDVDEMSKRGIPQEIAPNLPPNPDPFRSSRLIFLSGKRGTGKSTVLVSMFEAFLNRGPFCNGGEQKKSDIQKKESDIIEGKLKGLGDRLIWLEPLDMEPLPRPVNLLAAILARVDRAATRFTQKKDDKTYQSGLLSLATGENALHGLRKLAANIAIAWDGNVDARAGSLDPDAYAAEVNRVEDARIGINMGLNKALGELAQELSKGNYVKDPLFVLPVDDYDLNPLRSLELLHLIRMVSSPRLFIIVLGDIRTAEIMFNLKKSGEFAKVLEAAYTPKYLSLSASEIGGIARSLSGHAIRKLVPPGQRIELEPLEIHEALRFHPSHFKNGKGTDDGESLKSLLQWLPIDIETAEEVPPPESSDTKGPPEPAPGFRKEFIAGGTISSFWEFLQFNVLRSPSGQKDLSASTPRNIIEQTNKDKVAKDEEDALPYTGASVLKAAPRYIADLWFSVRELLGDKKELPNEREPWGKRLNQLINLIGRETHRALEEDELLSIPYRERFIDALGVGVDEEWLQAMRFIEARSLSIPGRLIPFRDHECVLHANLQRSWGFWDLEKERRIDIGERTKSLIILLHDLLALEREGGIVGSHSLSPNSLDLGWGFASWDLGLRDEVRVPWITPAWTSFWEFDQFGHIWVSALKKSKFWEASGESTLKSGHPVNKPGIESESLRRVFLLYTWVAGVNQILRKGSPTTTENIIPQSAEELTKSSLWEGLAKDIRQLILDSEAPTLRAERIKNWLIRLPVLLAPEAGLITANEDSDALLKKCADHLFNLFNEAQWKTFMASRSDKIRSLRADRLVPFMINKAKLKEFAPPKPAEPEESPKPADQTEHKIKTHPINHYLGGLLVPEDYELKKAEERAYRKSAKDPRERLAVALESFLTTLRRAGSEFDEKAQEGEI
jgi:hypothetical protein